MQTEHSAVLDPLPVFTIARLVVPPSQSDGLMMPESTGPDTDTETGDGGE